MRLVAILLLLHVQLLKLLLVLLLALALRLLALAFRDHVFARRKLQQRLIRRLLRGQRIRQRLGGIARLGQMFCRLLHLLHHILDQRLDARISHAFLHRFRLFERLRLRIQDHRCVCLVRVRRILARMFALQLPGGVDDLLLQFRELRGLVCLTFTRLALAGLRLRFAENFLERTHLGEIHVARCPAHVAVRPDVVRPQEPRDELVRLRAQVFKLQEVRDGLLLVRHAVRPHGQRHRVRAGHGVTQAVIAQTEIIPRLALEIYFLQRRDALVATRREQLQVRPAILERLQHELRGQFVRASIGINELQLIRSVGHQREVLQMRERPVRLHRQRHDGFVLADETRAGHRLVQL